jgi:putative hydrolase of the HAD superfamily
VNRTNGNTQSGGIEVVAFDGDDTLWHSESHFVDAHERFVALVAPYVDGDPGVIDGRVVDTERTNLAIYGYGAKAFTLSLIESAIELTGGRITSREISAILDLGKGLLGHPIELLDGVADVVAELAETGRRLIVVTKGDLFHQEAKVAGSGLSERFARVEIVSEKDVTTYRRVMDEAEVAPQHFLMIGNSVRSDVLPVVELGGHAAHLPYVYTWELEHVPDADAERQGFHELTSIRELPALVERLSATVGARSVGSPSRAD